MSGIGTPYIPDVDLVPTVAILSGAHTNTVATLTLVGALTQLPQSGIVLVGGSELVLVGAFNNGGGHHFTGCTRGAYGTKNVAQADSASVEEVMFVQKKQGGVLVYYYGTDDFNGALVIKFIEEPTESANLSIAADGDALHAIGADSTTGAVAVAGTLKVMRTDTTAHLMADAADNMATMFAIITALQTYVGDLEIVEV